MSFFAVVLGLVLEARGTAPATVGLVVTSGFAGGAAASAAIAALGDSCGRRLTLQAWGRGEAEEARLVAGGRRRRVLWWGADRCSPSFAPTLPSPHASR